VAHAGYEVPWGGGLYKRERRVVTTKVSGHGEGNGGKSGREVRSEQRTRQSKENCQSHIDDFEGVRPVPDWNQDLKMRNVGQGTKIQGKRIPQD